MGKTLFNGDGGSVWPDPTFLYPKAKRGKGQTKKSTQKRRHTAFCVSVGSLYPEGKGRVGFKASASGVGLILLTTCVGIRKGERITSGGWEKGWVVSGIFVCSCIRMLLCISQPAAIDGPIRIRPLPSLRPFGFVCLSYVSGWLGGGLELTPVY